MRTQSLLKNYVLVIIAFSLLPLSALAQYQVYSWENFDGGKLPPNMKFGLNANPENVVMADFHAPDAPAGMLNGIAETEIGRYGLKFMSSEKMPQLSVVSSTVLDRKKLGNVGKALYQVDFYISEESKKCYSMAVLAVVPPDSQALESYKMYRFGILYGDKLFFSYMNKEKAPLQFHTQPLKDFNLKVPGWHRIQIIFEGQKKIICAIDQIPAKFSPIEEPTLTQLQAGLMVTTNIEKLPIIPGTAYADNLSIQMTTEKDVPLPDSPWMKPDAYVAYRPTKNKPPVTTGQTNTSQPAATLPPQYGIKVAGLNWLVSPSQAWQESVDQKKPILIMFYVPHLAKYKELHTLILQNPDIQSFLKNYVLLGLDVNQLAGGQESQNFNIFKVPTFLVLGTDGKEKTRVMVSKNTTWQEIMNKVQQAPK